MELQFETPRSPRHTLIFFAAVILAIALWPAVEHVLGIVSPGLASPAPAPNTSTWDLRSMWN